MPGPSSSRPAANASDRMGAIFDYAPHVGPPAVPWKRPAARLEELGWLLEAPVNGKSAGRALRQVERSCVRGGDGEDRAASGVRSLPLRAPGRGPRGEVRDRAG